MSNKIYLISCVSKKQNVPAAARDIYISDWFQKARIYVEKTGAPWFILSAEYGLLEPDMIVNPYERTLNKMSVKERREWSSMVLKQLKPKINNDMDIVIFAGKRYREFLMEDLCKWACAVEIPMEGLRIGEQLSWFSRNNNK